jgi:hypothetical protein
VETDSDASMDRAITEKGPRKAAIEPRDQEELAKEVSKFGQMTNVNKVRIRPHAGEVVQSTAGRVTKYFMKRTRVALQASRPAILDSVPTRDSRFPLRFRSVRYRGLAQRHRRCNLNPSAFR